MKNTTDILLSEINSQQPVIAVIRDFFKEDGTVVDRALKRVVTALAQHFDEEVVSMKVYPKEFIEFLESRRPMSWEIETTGINTTIQVDPVWIY